jgi:hypothetical protein
MKSFNKALFCNSFVFCMVFLFSNLYSGKGFANVYVTTTFTDPVFTAVNNATGAITAGAGVGLISLRSALKAADNLGGTHTVTLSTGTYLLDGSTSYTVPSLGTFSARTIYLGNTTQNITINGNGPANTIIDMAVAGRDRIMTINYDGVVGDVVTTINGVKFQNGYLTTDEFGGAAIYAGPVGGLLQTLAVNNCTFDNNICPGSAGNGGVGGAIYMFQETLTVDNCTFTNNQSVDGVAGAIFFILYNNQGNDGNVNITNSTFSGNSAKSLGGAIHIASQGGQPGGTTFTTTINNNTFLNNFTTAGAGGAMALNNGANLSDMQVHYNRFVGNISFSSALSSGLHFVESAGDVNAENNWWGCNTNPVSAGSTAPCDQAGGDVPGLGSLDASPWIQLKTTASPSTICNTPAGLGNTSNVTTSFLSNSDGGVLTLANISRLIGLPVTWTSTLGSLSGQQLTIQASGTATATFTSNGTGGTATVNTQVDNVPPTEASPARANITVNTIPIVSNPANATSCVGGTAMFISTITGTPAPSIQWYKGTTVLVNGVQGSGSTVSGATTNTLTITNVQPGDAAINYNVRATNQCGEDTSANTTLFVNQVTGGTVGTDQTICSGGDPAAFTESVVSTGSGALTYQWQKSTTNCASGFSDIGGATATTYDAPSGVTVTTFYRRVTTSTLNGIPCTALSNCITVTINAVTGGTVGSDQTFCSPGDPAAFTQSVASTGSGALTYQWQSSTTDCSTGFSDIGGATATTYDPPSGLLVKTYYRRVTTSTLNGVPCTANSNCITVSINDVTGGTVGSDQTICQSGDPAAFTQSVASTGSGALTYQWQNSITDCSSNFNNIAGETGITYDPPPGLLTTNYYRRVTTSTLNGVPCTANSNCITVTVNNVSGGTVGSDQTICAGGDPAAFTESLASTGSGALTYQWQSSTTNCSGGFNDIGGATATTYDPPAGVLVTTFYRRITTSTLNGVPCTNNSNCITVTVNSVTGGSVGSDHKICIGGDPAAFTQNVASTGSGALTYQWQSSTTSCYAGFSDIGGATATTYDPPGGLGVTTYYLRVTTSTLSGVPCTANSNCITVTVNSNNTITLTSAPGTDAQTVVQFTPITPITYSTTGATGATFGGLPPGVNGNWAANVVTISGSPTSTGVYNYTVTLTGGCGGGTANGSITVNPPCTPPSFSPCPGNQSANTAPGTCAANVSYTASATGDPAPTLSYSFAGATTGSGSGTGSGLSFNKGITTVTITATNGCSPDATCIFTVTISDNQNPTAICPSSVTVNNDPDQCGAVVIFPNATVTDNCPMATVSCVPASGSFFPKGTTTVTCTAIDMSGNTGTCTFTVTVNDTQKPTITCPSNITDNAVTGTCGKVIFYNVTAADNCPGVTTMRTTGLGSGQIFPVGTTTETWKATDASGNTATCSFTVTIIDNQKPIITGCPSNQTKNTDAGICTTTATWVAPTASDNCPGVLFTSNYAPGATFPKGVTTVLYTATDASGNTETCSFTITVNDVEMPVISNCPSNTTVNAATDMCSATVTWTEPTATDNCMVSSFNRVPAGSTFNVGTTTVTYTATDMSGNTKTCSFSVTVVDNQLPKITCPGSAMRGVAEGTCKYTISGTEFNATATDNCGIAPPLTYTYTGPTSGSGNTSLNGVMLDKGLYTITWKATDVNGNMNTCSFTVDVKDNELPKITCPPDKTVVTSPGLCTASVALGSPTGVSDNCVMTTVTNNGLASYPVGMTIVTWTVTDMSGNTKTCTQKVTVIPYSCGAPTQVLHTDTTATTAKIKWKVGKCATSYQVRLRQELTPGVWGAWSAWVTFSGPAGPPQWTHQFTGLNPNKFHNSQVRSVCGSSFSASINDWWWTLPSFAPIEDRIASEENESQELPVNIAFIPNPAREFTTVMIEGFEQREKTITMFDLYGKLVFTVKVDANQNLIELDLDALNARTGIYLIRVSDDRKQKTEQLMIER